MAPKKRFREVGAGSWVGDSSSPGDEIAQQQPAAKRPRLAGFGLGSSVGALVDKVVRATASFLGRGRPRAGADQKNVDGDDSIDAAPIVDQVEPIDAASSIDVRVTKNTPPSVGANPCKPADAPADGDRHEEPIDAPAAPTTPALPATPAPAPLPWVVRNSSRNRNQKKPRRVGNSPQAGEGAADAAVDRTGKVSKDANVAVGYRHEEHHQSQERPMRTRRNSRKAERDDVLRGQEEKKQGPENINTEGGPYESGRPVKSPVVIDKRIGAQSGLPRIAATDALKHALGFLRAEDLARFADASTAAREVAFTHAALEIADRFPTLRLGIREPPKPTAAPRRLAFGSPAASSTAAAVAAAAAAVAAAADNGNPVANPETLAANHPLGVGNMNYPVHPHSSQQQQHHQYHHHGGIQHSALWDQEVFLLSPEGVSPTGSPLNSPVNRGLRSSTIAASARGLSGSTGISSSRGGGSMAGWRRHGRGSWEAAGLARCEGHNLELALPSLHYLELCGDLLLSQQKTMPRLDLFRVVQCRSVLGPSQFLTPHMRAVLVDWMVEVAFQFRLSTVALHAAVSALDVCLSKVAVPRSRLQLLGVVCTMIQSQAGGGCQIMSTTEAIHICDSQYNPSQVHSTFNIVVSNTQEATSRTVPSTAVEMLNRMLSCMGEVSGLTRNLSVSWDKQDEPLKEENVLAGLLMDLSLLDLYMFRFRPGTLAAAGLFFARVTALYYSKEEVWVTPFAVVEKSNREVRRLYGPGVCRPFIPLNSDLEIRPFGAPGLEQFVASQPREANAVRKCVDRLWLVHQDFLNHLAGQQPPQPVLFRYQHMFKGIKDKFVPPGSTRLQAYNRLGLAPKADLTRMLDKHLPSETVPIVFGNGNPSEVIPGVAAAPATG